jgi:hypothetical protein
MQIDSNGDIYGVTTIADASGQPFYRVIKKNDKLESIGTIGPLVKQPPLSLYGVSCPFFLVTKDDRVIYGFPDKYEFVIFDKYGTLTTKIRKEYVPISIPREDRDQILKKENPFNSDIPKYFAPYSGIDADEEGRIFINTEARLSQLNTYDVFSPGGQFIATIRLRSYRHPLWTNKRVYTIEEDGDGYFLIRVSRVEWKY